MRGTERPSSPPKALLAGAGTISQYQEKETIYSQGAASPTIFYIQDGMVMLTVRSKHRRAAVVAILGAGNFLNESCLLGRSRSLSTATTLTSSSILAIEKAEMIRLLRRGNEVSAFFISSLLSSILRFREDLVDVLVNSSEQRLARALLRLPRLGTRGRGMARIPKISQQVLADLIGTTRSRVNLFMNRFRKRGFIGDNGASEVHRSLRTVLLDH